MKTLSVTAGRMTSFCHWVGTSCTSGNMSLSGVPQIGWKTRGDAELAGMALREVGTRCEILELPDSGE
jgi:hypothetical protein